jgi:predicted RNA binding protein YcfA (HicA-like mRNA interferase family)
VKVRDLMKRLHDDGWRQVRMRGDHRVLKHPTKPGIVVVPGHPGDDLAIGTLKDVWKQAQLEGRP